MDVPITVEQSYRIYLFTGPPALLLLWPAVRFLLTRLKNGQWMPIESKALAAALALAVLMALVLLEPVGWQFRVDDDAITLKAPIDFFRAAGRIPWNDVSRMRIVWAMGRTTRYRELEIYGADGSKIELSALDGMPKTFGPAFMTVVERHSRVTTLKPSREKFEFELNDALAAPTPDRLQLMGYVVRDGSNRILQ